MFWYKNIKPHLVNRNISSEMPIDVIIPAIEKDLEILPYTIEGNRRNVKHPISKILIVSPSSERIERLCSEKGCSFVNEKSVINIDPQSLHLIIRGLDRSNWYFQQFLKLSSDKISDEENILLVDADTVFIRPQIFGHSGNIILNFSDEYHQPYFDHYKHLIKETVNCPVSFTSHHMLCEKSRLMELRKKIEEINGCAWHEAILKNVDKNEVSGCSEYEIYGQFVFLHYRKKYSLEYWFNLSLPRNKLQDLDRLETLYKDNHKSISFHSWNK